MTNKKPKRSNQSNAISRWDDEGGASSAGDRSVRKRSSGIGQQPVKGAAAPTHTEDRQSNSDVPGKGRLAVRGGVLRKKGRQSNNGTANATDKANVHQTGVETAMA
jgi:hypothetical protein